MTKYCVTFETANGVQIPITVEAESEETALEVANSQLSQAGIRPAAEYSIDVAVAEECIGFKFSRGDLGLTTQDEFDAMLNAVDCSATLESEIIELMKEHLVEYLKEEAA